MKEELIYVKNNLLLEKLKGKGNHCSNCNKDGSFGSIVKYKAKDKSNWLICGWCGNIERIKE